MMRSDLREVRIRWVDSFAKHGWANKEEYLQEMRGNFECVSRGAVLDEDDERVTLILTESEGAVNQALTIPKCCIVSREELDENLKQMRVYFLTHAPGEWMYSKGCVDLFRQIYGDEAIVDLELNGTIPENDDPTWIGGTATNTIEKALEAKRQGKMFGYDEITVDVPEHKHVETPFGDVDVPVNYSEPITSWTKNDFIAVVRALLKEATAK